MAMFVCAIRTVTFFGVKVVDVTASVIVLVFLSGIIHRKEVCGKSAVTKLVMCLEEMVVVERLGVATTTVSIVNVNNVIPLVNIEGGRLHVMVWRILFLLFFLSVLVNKAAFFSV